jgi:hypothetical protein
VTVLRSEEGEEGLESPEPMGPGALDEGSLGRSSR